MGVLVGCMGFHFFTRKGRLTHNIKHHDTLNFVFQRGKNIFSTSFTLVLQNFDLPLITNKTREEA